MSRGLVPAWASTPDFAPVNARAETAAVKPTFRDAFRHRRCVLPVLGWYEWRRDGRRKTPFLIRDAGGETMHLAALWERWRRAGGPLEGFAVLTTGPRDELRAIHDRQPAVLDTPTAIDDWLDPQAPRRRVQALAEGRGRRPPRVRAVSTAVNDPRNDGAWLLDTPAEPQQPGLE